MPHSSDRPTIGVVSDCFRLRAKDALQQAATLGFRATQTDATRGDLDPRELTGTGRRHVRRYLADLGLTLSALGGAYTRGGLIEPTQMDERLAHVASILELARDIGGGAVTTYLGPVGDDPTAAGRAREALIALAERADVLGVTIAVESAGTSGEQLAALLDGVDSPLIKICYDPGAVLLRGGDAIAELGAVGGQIAVAHLRDAVPGDHQRSGHEAAIGEGALDIPTYLAALAQAEHHGPVLLRRHEAPDPLRELAEARQRIEHLLQRHL